MTVGEIRKAIEGLPDEAFVTLMTCLSEDADETCPTVFIRSVDAFQAGGRLMIQIGVDVTDAFDDEDEDDDDDFEDEDD